MSSEGENPPTLRQEVKGDATHALRAAAFLAVHTDVVLFFTLLIVLTHFGFKAAGDPLIFDRFPIRYIFEAGELGVIVLFVVGGIGDARAAFKQHRK